MKDKIDAENMPRYPKRCGNCGLKIYPLNSFLHEDEWICNGCLQKKTKVDQDMFALGTRCRDENKDTEES